MARTIELLLLKNIENLGIVGDLVNVRPGFARNYLLPHALAEFPTPEKVESLKDARAKALGEVAAARSSREQLLARMNDVAVNVVRSCNDQGILYGSISQRDIADALQGAGFGVDIRAVRLAQSIRRVGTYHVPIQLDKDLRTEITLNVQADRQLEREMRSSTPEPEVPADASAEGAGADSDAPRDRKNRPTSGAPA